LGGEIISLSCCKWLQINRPFFQAVTDLSEGRKWIEWEHRGGRGTGQRGTRDSSFIALPSSFILRPVAARLRSETTLATKWIALRMQIGTAKGAKSVLHLLAQSQGQREAAKALEPCAQLELQSTV
jgi:hypothetical protein